MIQEFSNDTQQDAHRQFQQWRRAHPTGFFINRKSRTTYLLHTALCRHPGDTEWGADIGASLTRNRKICSTSITDLEAWALSRGLSLRHCQDCAPADALGNYIAYHSSEVMGREYGPPAERFHFYSQKAESFLRQAIGRRVWVIASTRSGSRTSYRLAGMFTPSTVRPENDGFGILGNGVPFRPPLEVTTLPWFAELLREQNRFSYGFNRIRNAKIVAEMHRLLEQRGGESVLQPDEVATPSQFFEGATRQVSVNRYERNPYARQQCIQHYGCRCSVCGFDFETVYGELGSGFIHVHHLKALSEIGQEYEIDPVADLRPICPNCHAMIHRDIEMMTIEQLREVIQSHIRSANKTVQRTGASRSAPEKNRKSSAAGSRR